MAGAKTGAAGKVGARAAQIEVSTWPKGERGMEADFEPANSEPTSGRAIKKLEKHDFKPWHSTWKTRSRVGLWSNCGYLGTGRDGTSAPSGRKQYGPAFSRRPRAAPGGRWNKGQPRSQRKRFTTAGSDWRRGLGRRGPSCRGCNRATERGGRGKRKRKTLIGGKRPGSGAARKIGEKRRGHQAAKLEQQLQEGDRRPRAGRHSASWRRRRKARWESARPAIDTGKISQGEGVFSQVATFGYGAEVKAMEFRRPRRRAAPKFGDNSKAKPSGRKASRELTRQGGSKSLPGRVMMS